jgi:hypothetical protein
MGGLLCLIALVLNDMQEQEYSGVVEELIDRCWRAAVLSIIYSQGPKE